MKWIITACIAIGCGSRSASPPIGSTTATTPLEAAEAYERGTNGPRDYRKAAEIYDAACIEGRGDLAACRKLLDARLSARGVPRDLSAAVSLADALCKRHDLMGCTVVVFSAPDDAPAVAKAELEKVDLEERCGKRDAVACEVMLALEFPNFQGSSGVEAKQERRAELACRAGVRSGCLALIERVTACAYQPAAQRCVDKQVAAWKEYGNPSKLDALAVVRRDCDRGDAVACAALPGREVSYDALCKAHDYTACGNAGCLGNAAAAALATAHQARPNCMAVENREAARHEEPPATRAALPAEPARATPPPRDLPPFRSLAFRRLATKEDDWGWPRLEVTSLSKRKVIYVRYVQYAYDKAGRQVARSERSSMGPMLLDPGKSAEIDPYSNDRLPGDAVAFDICYDFISFEGDTSSARGGTTNATPCPEQWVKGNGGPPLDASGAPAQRKLHALAVPAATHYAMTEGLKDGGSAHALTELAAGTIHFAGSNERAVPAGHVAVPVVVAALGVIYRVKGVTDLRLSPATLAKIVARTITTWNDPAIAKDNPQAKLPAIPIVLFREVGHDSATDRDVDATRALAGYLARAAKGVWSGTWPAETQRAGGLSGIVHGTEGAISFLEVSTAEPGTKFAAIRNRAGAYVTPTPASLRAAAAELDVKTGTIDPKQRGAYPIAFPSYIVVATKQPDKTRGTRVVAYLRYLLDAAQRELGTVGLAALPDKVLAHGRALVDSITLPP